MAKNLAIDHDTLREIYRQMSRIHEVDKAIQAGLSSGKFQFTYWPLTGQEAIPASIAPLITEKDYMVTIYRGIHDQVAKGVPLKGLFAEALGRVDGVNKGKGGSPHISDPGSGSMLTTAIVGAGAPIANGLALASKMRGTDAVTIVNFGDGATSIGAIHEAMNLAGIWKLPVIFLCQNNQMGEYTPIPEYSRRLEQLVQRMLIAAAVVCNLLVAGGLWYASGSLLVGTVGLMVFLVVQGTVFRMFSM